MPRTQKEIQKKLDEINKQMDAIIIKMKKINERAKNGSATIDDQIQLEVYFATSRLFNAEFQALLFELSKQ